MSRSLIKVHDHLVECLMDYNPSLASKFVHNVDEILDSYDYAAPEVQHHYWLDYVDQLIFLHQENMLPVEIQREIKSILNDVHNPLYY